MPHRPRPFPTLLLGLAPWPAVAVGLYVLHSAVWAFALYHAVCLTGWYFARKPLPSVPDAVWRARQWTQLGITCFIVNLGVYFFAGIAGAIVQPERVKHALTFMGVANNPAAYIALFCYFGFVNPVVEELFWRETIHARLREASWPPGMAAGLSGILFGAWHWLPVRLFFPFPISLVIVGGIAATGVVLGLLYDRSRSLPASILLHAAGADLPILLILYLSVLR